jgi:pilus assembly protein Flp/PilA
MINSRTLLFALTLLKGFEHRLWVNYSQEKQMRAVFTRLFSDEAGVTAIEYGLIAALIAVVIITALTTLGGDLSTLFTTIATSL